MKRMSLAALAFAGLLAAAAPALADGPRMMPRTISLSGHGEVRSVPDMAFVTSGVVSQGATAGDALAANTKDMNALFAALKEAGIAEKDIQTSNFSVQPRYDFSNGQAPKLVGYDVTNNVTVTLRKIADLGPLLDKMVQAGSNQISGVSFQVSKPDAAMDQARKLAADDARHKAEVYAKAMGVELGPVMMVNENGGFVPPMPMVRGVAMKADGAAAPVPMAAGEQALSVDVNVTWEIR